MSVTSNRSVTIQNTFDVEYSQSFSAQQNEDGSGTNFLQELATGDNDISVPEGAIAVTIIKPDDNEVVLTLKGDAGDVGFTLNPIDPDSISLFEVGNFVINVSDDVTLRFIFT